MTDRENVIKGLKYLHDVKRWSPNESEESITARRNITGDAIALLKAQEPMEPVFDAGDGKNIGQFLCGKCHAKIGFGYPHFCWYCGRKVKWE